MRIHCNWALLLAISLSILPRVRAQPPTPQVGGTTSTAKLDADGEPLPPGAHFRLGTRHWRHRGEGYSICYSPDSKKIALTSRYCDVVVLNVKTGRREFAGKLKLKDGSSLKASAIAFSPSGQELAARSLSSRLKMVALKDFTWEKGANGWQSRWCPLGEGMVNWTEFFQLLTNIPFAGPVSVHIEYDPGGRTRVEKIDNNLAAAERDIAFVRKHLAAIK
jgi:hypothetical protein